MQSGNEKTKPDSSLGWGHLPRIAVAPETGAASGWGWAASAVPVEETGGVSPRGGVDRTGGQPRAGHGGERARAESTRRSSPAVSPVSLEQSRHSQRGTSRWSGFCGVEARVRGLSGLSPGVRAPAAFSARAQVCRGPWCVGDLGEADFIVLPSVPMCLH